MSFLVALGTSITPVPDTVMKIDTVAGPAAAAVSVTAGASIVVAGGWLHKHLTIIYL